MRRCTEWYQNSGEQNDIAEVWEVKFIHQASQRGRKMQRILCVSFLQILFALTDVLAVASQRNYLLGRYEGRNHRHEDMVAGLSGKLSAPGSRSTDDHEATRHQLQQTSTSAEIEALMAFKEGITNDSLGALSDWNPNEADPCHWEGVTCGQRSNSIVALDLGSFQLMGTISPLLGRLANLQSLNLSDNYFQGEIPNTLLNCTHLSYLALRNNNLTGEIPSQVGDLLLLQYLDLGSNLLLAGRIPASLSNCSLLRFIHLNFTTVHGDFASSFGQLPHLESLNLTFTFISGTIPKSLGNCSYLTELTVGNNYDLFWATSSRANNPEEELSGKLPVELAELKQLKVLGIAGSNIEGVFPTWIANLTSLTTLALAFSSFTGEIPQFLGNLPLEFIFLAGSGFSGAIPAAISNCSNLWSLIIDVNPNMRGPIPPEFGMLRKLKYLEFDSNGLTGTIPPSLSNCSALTRLELGENPLLDPQPVPSWVASLINLTLLNLGDMNLQGEIPIALGRLSKLDHLMIWGNQLTGQIPATLGNCTSLVHLELHQNQLSGELPPEIWMLSQLQYFQLNDNFLTGTLSASTGNLSFLQTFDCDTNLFSGGIPSQLGSLQSLVTADFDTNLFDDSIPESLGNCSVLRYLSMSGNQLSGSIPAALGNLTFGELYLSGNLLGGGIPVELMRCTAFSYLDLSHNQLVGSIPQEIGQLVSLQGLYLNDNQLSGELPKSLGLLTGLSFLDVSYNALDGAVPGEVIANISSILNSLNLSHNHLFGSLPLELGELLQVNYLDFSVNNFSGFIPLSLGDCKSLLRLDLSMNNLSGGIPPALAQLQYLSFVNVSYNHLQGPVPDGGVFNSSNLTAESFLGNPELCGGMLKGCPAGGPSRGSSSSCKAFGCASVKLTITLTCVGGGVLLVSVAVLIYWLLYHHGKNDGGQFHTFSFATGLKVTEEELFSIIERPENMIGVGATSTVYKGVLNGTRTVAIKVLSLLNDSDDHEHNPKAAATQLHIEAHTLAQLKHRNIVKVFGLLSSPSIKALIIEFMPNASLYQQLYGVAECQLRWGARLDIALGVAQGVVYLHSQAHVPVIHRDLNSSNIFLDADLEPKLGDFGISRFVNPDRSGDAGEITASKFCGTVGYIPPEYATTTRVSTKGDVYSYGVVLLELLTRKPPIVTMAQSDESDLGQHGEQSRHLVEWVLESSKKTPLAVLDPMLLTSERISPIDDGEDNNSGEQMKLLMQVGLLCTQHDPQSRPQMSDVLAMLVQIKERGSDPAHRPTVAELADEITIWPAVPRTPSVSS